MAAVEKAVRETSGAATAGWPNSTFCCTIAIEETGETPSISPAEHD
jgi:hypothetical protein